MPGPAYPVGRDNGTGPLGLLHDLLDQGMVAAKTVATCEGQYRNHDFSGRVCHAMGTEGGALDRRTGAPFGWGEHALTG